MSLLDKLLGMMTVKALREENEILIKKLDKEMERHDFVLYQLKKCKEKLDTNGN